MAGVSLSFGAISGTFNQRITLAQQHFGCKPFPDIAPRHRFDSEIFESSHIGPVYNPAANV